MKIAAGVHQPDAGTVSIDGQSPPSPADAIRLGVSLVRQELIQAEDLDVGSNVLLGHEPHRFGIVDRAALYSRAQKVLARVGGDIDPRTPLRSLSPGQKQRTEIARALSLDAKVLLLDEPTATLERDRCGAPVHAAARSPQERHRHGLHLAPAARGPGDHRPRGLPARRRAGGRAADRARRRWTSSSSCWPEPPTSPRLRRPRPGRRWCCRCAGGCRSICTPARSWGWPGWSAPGAAACCASCSACAPASSR